MVGSERGKKLAKNDCVIYFSASPGSLILLVCVSVMAKPTPLQELECKRSLLLVSRLPLAERVCPFS